MVLSSFFSSRAKNKEYSAEDDRKKGLFIFALALTLGAFFRLSFPIKGDFVVMDGGLFYLFAQEIRAHNFVLPTLIPYATDQPAIPFCYPPLAFYVIALLNVFGIPLEWSLRFLPAAFSVATIWAVWRLAKTIVRDLPNANVIAGLSAYFFALLPWSFSWMIMGGGITRSPGLFFAILGIEQAISHWRDGEKKALWQSSFLLGITILIHLERARFLVVAVFLVWLLYNHKIQGVKSLFLFLCGGLVISSPWWIICLTRFGIEPFLASYASGNSEWLLQSRFSNFLTVELFFPALTLLAVYGFFLYWKKLPFLWIWCAVITYVEVRSGRNFLSLPLGIGIALAFAYIKPNILQKTLLGLGTLWLLFQSAATANSYSTITHSQVMAMKWCSENTPKTAEFLVVPFNPNHNWDKNWPKDITLEWFPALAHRASPMTVQGSEWLGGGTFAHQIKRYGDVSSATNWHDMQKQLAYHDTKFDWIFFPKDEKIQPRFHAKNIEREIRADKTWRVAFENESTIIFRRTK